MQIIDDFRQKILNIVNNGVVEDTVWLWQMVNGWLEIPNRFQIIKGIHVPIYKSDTQAINNYPILKVKIILITHPEMRSVWKSINKQMQKKMHDNEDWILDGLLTYMDEIYSAVTGRSYWETLRPAQRDKEYNDLIYSLKEVAERLSKVGCHDTVSDAITGRYLQTYTDGHEGGDYNQIPPIKIPDLLHAYADLLKIEERHVDVLTDRPNSGNASVSYFARSLYNTHQRDFGSPLWETISSIAGVFYPDHDTSTKKMRASIRSMR